MKINQGDFGYRTPGAPGRVDVPAGAFVTPGMADLGAVGMKIGAEIAQGEAQDAQMAYSEAHRARLEAEAEAKTIAREAKRAEAMTIHAKAQTSLAEAHDQIANGVRDGTIGVDAAPKLWQESSSKIVDDHLKGVDKSNVELVRAGLVGNVSQFGRQINDTVVTRNRQIIGAKLNDYLEEMQRLGISDLETAKKQGVMAIRSQGPLADYNPKEISKMEHAFVENTTFNAVNNMLIKSANNRGALDKFVKALPNMPDLDEGKRNILLNQAQHQITTLENKAIAAENRRLNTLAATGSALEQRIAMGIPVAPADLLAFQTQAKGTPFEKNAMGLVEEQRTVTELLRKTPAEQSAYVGQLEQRLMTTGEGNVKLITRLKQTVGNTIKMLDQNPLQYAMDRGGAQVQPLDITKPDSWQANLANRAQILDTQAKTVGGSMGALFPQEAAVLAGIMATGTPEQKKAYLEPIRRGLANDQVFLATVQQFAKDSPVTANAAAISTKETPITLGRVFKETFTPGDISARILNGESLINPPKSAKQTDGKSRGFPMPSGTEQKAMDQHFADAVGEMFADNFRAYDTQLQTARSYYADRMNAKGKASGEYDSGVWAEAIAVTTPLVKFNGKPVMAPWGMGEDQFKDKIASALPAAVIAAGLPKEVANATGRFTLQNNRGNTYFVRQGTEYLTGPKGRVVVTVPELGQAQRDEKGRKAAYQVPD